MHICNEKDWNDLYPPSKSSKNTIDEFKETNSLLCFNELDVEGKPWNKDLYGKLDTIKHSRF